MTQHAFDFAEPDPPPAPRRDPATCKHKHEEKTETVWPGETIERLTWTCPDCGKVRGRC